MIPVCGRPDRHRLNVMIGLHEVMVAGLDSGSTYSYRWLSSHKALGVPMRSLAIQKRVSFHAAPSVNIIKD